ncbi:MAG: hypothetical protein DRN27_08510 [Thermoplasmata archaeon]|nr:MAG: hypothetical protein DRN27_08510 [Thermoplasmata archaeon]
MQKWYKIVKKHKNELKLLAIAVFFIVYIALGVSFGVCATSDELGDISEYTVLMFTWLIVVLPLAFIVAVIEMIPELFRRMFRRGG